MADEKAVGTWSTLEYGAYLREQLYLKAISCNICLDYFIQKLNLTVANAHERFVKTKCNGVDRMA